MTTPEWPQPSQRWDPGGSRRGRRRPADLDAISKLALAQTRSEMEFGSAIDRADAAEQLRAELAGQLDAPDPWVWLAEDDGGSSAR